MRNRPTDPCSVQQREVGQLPFAERVWADVAGGGGSRSPHLKGHIESPAHWEQSLTDSHWTISSFSKFTPCNLNILLYFILFYFGFYCVFLTLALKAPAHVRREGGACGCPAAGSGARAPALAIAGPGGAGMPGSRCTRAVQGPGLPLSAQGSPPMRCPSLWAQGAPPPSLAGAFTTLLSIFRSSPECSSRPGSIS